jgi:hypothetical protein
MESELVIGCVREGEGHAWRVHDLLVGCLVDRTADCHTCLTAKINPPETYTKIKIVTINQKEKAPENSRAKI